MDHCSEGTNTSNKAENQPTVSQAFCGFCWPTRSTGSSPNASRRPCWSRQPRSGCFFRLSPDVFMRTVRLGKHCTWFNFYSYSPSQSVCMIESQRSRLLCSHCMVQPSSQDLKIVNKDSSESSEAGLLPSNNAKRADMCCVYSLCYTVCPNCAEKKWIVGLVEIWIETSYFYLMQAKVKRSLLYSCYQPYWGVSNRRHGVFKRLVWHLAQAQWRQKALNVGESARGSILLCKCVSWRTKVSVMSDILSSPEQITGPHTPLYAARLTAADKTKFNDEFSNPGPQPSWKPCTVYPALHTHLFLSSSLLHSQSANRETADSTGDAYLSMALCASADPTCRSFCHFHRFFSLGGGGTRKDHLSVTW